MRRACSSSGRLIILIQSVRCIVTPLPRVTNPTISSPGIGLQHFAKPHAPSSIPCTVMPALDFVTRTGAASFAVCAASIICSSVILLVIEPIALEQLSHDLSFLQSAVSERRQCRISVAENPYFVSTRSIYSGFKISCNTIPFALQ